MDQATQVAEVGVEVDAVGQLVVVGEHEAALAGREQLAVVGGEAPGPADGAGVPAADAGPVGLAGILHDGHSGLGE